MRPFAFASLDQLGRLGDRRRHRLVEVDVLARRERLLALLVVQADRRGDRHRVDLALLEQVLEREEGVLPAELLDRGLGSTLDRVADRPDLDPILDVLLRQMGHDAADRDAPGPDHTHSHDVRH